MPYYNPKTMVVHDGDKQPGEILVPARPSPYHAWNVSAWQLDKEAWLQGEVRPKRDALLDEMDLRYCNASNWDDMTGQERKKWKDYKKALKDLPATIDPYNPVWPKRPE